MIDITSISKVNLSEYDEVWAIVRSLRNNPKGIKQVPELAPSQELYSWYYKTSQAKEWNEKAFNETYMPWFIKDMLTNEKGIERLNELKGLDEQGKKVALLCFCSDEKICHRSIVAGLLMGMGVRVNVWNKDNDYIKYWDKYQDLKEKENKVKSVWGKFKKTQQH